MEVLPRDTFLEHATVFSGVRSCCWLMPRCQLLSLTLFLAGFCTFPHGAEACSCLPASLNIFQGRFLP